MLNPDEENQSQITSINLIMALNAVATELQQSIRSEENVYKIFQKQVVNLGLRGGISELDPSCQYLTFRTIAFNNPLSKILQRFEQALNLTAKGYTVDVNQVDVYRTVTQEGKAIFVPDTSTVSAQVVPNPFQKIVQPLMSFLGQPPGIFAPIVYDGEIQGMLNMVGPKLTAGDVPALQAFANQIAVALENARLFAMLQDALSALETAYQATLEGWVRALDMRDRETEGHSLRVAENTVDLARFMGVAEADLPHVRRGALLHDVGKVAVPDTILHKPGPLNNDEWAAMKLHPQMAYQWLKPIEYLGPAVVIPYCHHERWDGRGYVQGLADEDIPYWARIFAVVDVWDAMRSDRPYRKGQPDTEAAAYIQSESGRHFDPKVVEAFLICTINLFDDLAAFSIKTDQDRSLLQDRFCGQRNHRKILSCLLET